MVSPAWISVPGCCHFGSQIGAHASLQSEPVADRATLDAATAAATARFGAEAVPRPAHWGGYLVAPVMIEFWQGRNGRLHDRIRYCRDGAVWHIERLQP